MWAGGRLRWEAGNPLRVGQEVQRVSTIRSVQHKTGRSGELLFVLVEHRFSNQDGLALTEEHDIVYRAAASPATRCRHRSSRRWPARRPGRAPSCPTTCCCSATRR
jgi:hydroxyacyl-ACP dehydratase HTD2-like protein with hotdog domain